MPSAAEILLDEIETRRPRATLEAENLRLRTAILAAVERLGRIQGEPREDVELQVAIVRDELAAAVG